MKQALILENIDSGSTYSFLRASDFYISRKILNSSVKNWISINDLLESDDEKKMIVVGKFTESVLKRFLNISYKEVSELLITNLLERDHIIFVFSDNYQRRRDCQRILWKRGFFKRR